MFYDGLARLLSADYSAGADYAYGYDVAGNMVNNNGVTRTYNAANQMTNDGTNTLTYDNNGNLTNDGVNSYTWDRANRMLTALGSTSYKYDGVGNRIQQTVSGVVTAYLNDVQPGLTQLLAETVSGNTTRYVQGVRGIHATESNAGVWSYFAQDGLGSVRGIVDNAGVLGQTHQYDPYGKYIGTVPTSTYFGFTGEQTDGNRQVYLRARYYNPGMATFTTLDPFEGMTCTPMSLNGYSWVEGNPVMNTDPTGKNRQWADIFNGGSCFDFQQGGTITPTPPPTTTPTATSTPAPCALLSGPMNYGLSESQAGEQIANIIAAIGFQQNRHLGYDAMVLTMVAAMNILDRGAVP